MSPGNRPEVTIHESENKTSVTGDLILDLPKVKVVNIKNPRPGGWSGHVRGYRGGGMGVLCDVTGKIRQNRAVEGGLAVKTKTGWCRLLHLGAVYGFLSSIARHFVRSVAMVRVSSHTCC